MTIYSGTNAMEIAKHKYIVAKNEERNLVFIDDMNAEGYYYWINLKAAKIEDSLPSEENNSLQNAIEYVLEQDFKIFATNDYNKFLDLLKTERS